MTSNVCDVLLGEPLAEQALRDPSLEAKWRKLMATKDGPERRFFISDHDVRYAFSEMRQKKMKERGINAINWGTYWKPYENARRALSLLDAKRRSLAFPGAFPFERLPPEIRREVYSYLFAGRGNEVSVFIKNYLGRPENHKSFFWSNPDLRILSGWRTREGDYEVSGGLGIELGILCANRAIHREAEPVLYQMHDFDFNENLQLVAPFLETMSDVARRNIRFVALALPTSYVGHTGRYRGINFPSDKDSVCLTSWDAACSYLARHMHLRTLAIDIETTVTADFEEQPWVKNLIQITGLQKLSISYKLAASTPLATIPPISREQREKIRIRKRELFAYLKSTMLAKSADSSLLLPEEESTIDSKFRCSLNGASQLA